MPKLDDDVLASLTHARAALEEALCTDTEGLSPEALAQSCYLLWDLCLSCGDRAAALNHLAHGIALHPVRLGRGETPRAVLALAVPGDLQANIPLSHLLEPGVAVHVLWVTPDLLLRLDALRLPGVEAAVTVMSESVAHHESLSLARQVAQRLGLPMLNDPRAIAGASRTTMAVELAGIGGLVVPPCQAVNSIRAPDPALFPALVRPLASHAGQGLFLCDTRAQFLAWRESCDEPMDAYVTRFVDVRSADGLYRKYRVVFVNGEPFPVHLAIHDDWGVWYYNAGMERFAGRRAEEERFLGDIGAVLGASGIATLREIAARVGLDYCGLDFGRLDDGRLVLFEVETGMIVHDNDPAEIYPYKAPAIARIRAAFGHMLGQRAATVGIS